jgi:hypothetical protein
MEYSAQLSEETQPVRRASYLLEQAEQAASAGHLRDAYELALQATETAPGYAEAWAMRATLASSLEEKVACMNRLNELQPEQNDRRNSAYYFLKELFDRDPFLAYLNETQELYHVVNKDMLVLRIPKKRTAMQPFPPAGPNTLSPAYRWLWLALFGLMLAGVPTLLFAPMAAQAALRVAGSHGSSQLQIQSTAVQLAAVALFGIGCFFTLLFVLHVM